MGERDEVMRDAATMYYIHGESMDAIARRFGVSRSSISRTLKNARETGMVQISIQSETRGASSAARKLRDLYGVHAHVVPVRSGIGDAERIDKVASVAAHLLGDWMQDDTVLGVAWGTTTWEVARQLTRHPTHGSMIVQLNGAANTHTTGIGYASQIISTIAEAFDAKTLFFPVPAFFDYAETKAAMWRERSVARVLGAQRRAQIVLFGVGAMGGSTPSHVYAAGYLDDADMREVAEEGVVGDICTVFLRADGTYRDIAINRRATGPTPSELTRVARRVCVVAGDSKVSALIAALRAHVVTDLVIDELTARAVITAST